jgi:hypothetical protein
VRGDDRQRRAHPREAHRRFHGLGAPARRRRLVLSWLATAVGQELVDQIVEAVVVGECTCGCSSVRLSTPTAPMVRDPGRERCTICTARAPDAVRTVRQRDRLNSP